MISLSGYSTILIRRQRDAHSQSISRYGNNRFLGKRIGDTVDGMFVGEGDQTLTGYTLEITGGSDTTGRAMRPDLDGGGVKPVLVSPGRIQRKEVCE